MTEHSLILRLTDIVEAIDLIEAEMAEVTLAAFEADKRKRWLVERGVEIISEASRHLGDELKARHPDIACRRWRASAISYAMSITASPTTCFGMLSATIFRRLKGFVATNSLLRDPTSRTEGRRRAVSLGRTLSLLAMPE
jgi:hypothetical protein